MSTRYPFISNNAVSTSISDGSSIALSSGLLALRFSGDGQWPCASLEMDNGLAAMKIVKVCEETFGANLVP